jgi:hypothetical protein
MKLFISQNGEVLIPGHDVLANEVSFDHDPNPITDQAGRPGYGFEGKVIFAWIDGEEVKLRLQQGSDVIPANRCYATFGFSHSNDNLVEWEATELDAPTVPDILDHLDADGSPL